MSDTPRTDEYAGISEDFRGVEVVPADISRELEKRLAVAQKEIERLKSLVIECSGWNWLDDEGYDSIPEETTDAVDVIIVERLNMPKG